MEGTARIRLARLMLGPVLLGLLLATAGCNTTAGVGRDISAAGEGLSGASQATEDKIKEEM
jgi:predicted small secreted protein